jgi:drug/metabolite transporter (DMT)-like permease
VTAVLLALGASLTWGFADFGAGFGARRLPVFVVATIMQLAGLVSVGVVLLVTRDAPPSWRQVAWAVFAGLLGVVGLSAFYRGLAVGAMGIVGPISTTAAIVPFAYGLARGERPSPPQLAGVALAVLGVLGASLERRPEGRGRQVGTGVGLALLAALGFGCSLIGLSRAAPGGITWAVLVMRIVAVPCMTALAFTVGAARAPSRRMLWMLIAVGIADTGATLLYAAASTRGLLSIVAVLASLYPVVIVVLARVLLAERVARPQLAGVAVALIGVALISAG